MINVATLENSKVIGHKRVLSHYEMQDNEVIYSDDVTVSLGMVYNPETNEFSVDLEAEARQWRDAELVRTDDLALLTDYPNKEALLTYRQALRDWTATEDFPEIRPTLGE